MTIVGVTGGIGSGKSTVCKVFEVLGVPVYYADEESKLLLNDPVILKKISANFGEDVIIAGKVDRKRLSAIVFENTEKLDALNQIMHPAVIEHFDQWCKANSASHYVIKEAAILFESGTYKNVQKIITVTAPEKIRIARVMKRDGLSEDEIKRRIGNQLGDEEKIKRSDYVLVNDEEQLLLPGILKLHEALSALQS